jgi:lipoprotein-anchoring transpeptidase ErfK/SrfK
MSRIIIRAKEQTLDLLDDDGKLLKHYRVSTARKGLGEQNGSNQTPRGQHIVRAKIGGGAPANTVFRARRPTGELYSDELAEQFPERDWILTRILWLSGREPGFNRLGDVDTMRRYIYIHGCPDNAQMGVPESIGCVRMHNADIIELYDLIPPGTPVEILE